MNKQDDKGSRVGELGMRLWLGCCRMTQGWSNTQRGDVPGWVLITVMTAGLVTAIWLVADTQLKAVLERAMSTLGTK